ncbi:Rv1733c family protein [Streptomyces sp. WZ-12]|uniref:Rv1733c family protein n=1 Tax=Streptomyces sp. WZ-12 TaxID=3030210 RepID=UPI002380D83C|nr:hypothetical protein [Streptomyces sp. WZ-12]
MRAIRGIWHWRGNPLRRRTDRWEAWLALGAALLIAVGAPAAGWFAGRAAHGALLTTVRLQRHERRPVWATVTRPASGTRVVPDPDTSVPHPGHPRVLARWAGPDGGPRSGEVATPRPVRAGERFRLWTDAHGRPAPPPMDEGTAGTHAGLAGAGAAVAFGGLVEGARRLAVRQLMVRRFRRWDAAWERAGQDWGRADAGS